MFNTIMKSVTSYKTYNKHRLYNCHCVTIVHEHFHLTLLRESAKFQDKCTENDIIVYRYLCGLDNRFDIYFNPLLIGHFQCCKVNLILYGILYIIMLYTAIHYTILHYTAIHYTALQYTVIHYTIIQ